MREAQAGSLAALGLGFMRAPATPSGTGFGRPRTAVGRSGPERHHDQPVPLRVRVRRQAVRRDPKFRRHRMGANTLTKVRDIRISTWAICATCRPDGWLVTGCSNGTVRAWNPVTGKPGQDDRPTPGCGDHRGRQSQRVEGVERDRARRTGIWNATDLTPSADLADRFLDLCARPGPTWSPFQPDSLPTG
jgi:hypothetical protein